MTAAESVLVLNMIPGLGSIRIQHLLSHFASPEIILHASPEMLMQVRGVGHDLAHAIASWRSTTRYERELELAEQAGVRVTTIFDDDYPSILRLMPDPPVVLYSRGQWCPKDGEKSIAVVGSRMATHYGRAVARRMSFELAEQGVTIISGLARGVDTEAHKAALVAHGRTVAVIGSGFNCLYPEENRALSEEIAAGHGAVVSEFPMNMSPSRSSFPMRNRVVAAWSHACLVIEAPSRSGSLITARQAAEIGHQVYAVPGPVDRPQSEGCHDLIRDGAMLVTCSQHILEDCHWSKKVDELPLFAAAQATTEKNRQVPPQHETDCLVWKSLQLGTQSLDALCSATGLSAQELAPSLTRLQMKRYIVPVPGAQFRLL